MEDERHDQLEQAFDGLERESPDRVARAIRWLRDPAARWIRIPLGLLLIAGGVFGFLPVLGFEFIPLGLLLIAQDIPFLRQPVGRMTLWLLRKWVHLRQWWAKRRKRR